MRRVAVTGLGIVSPIGDDADEVTAALREARSGVVAAPEYAEIGFRCQVARAPADRLGGPGRPPRRPVPGRRHGLRPHRHGAGHRRRGPDRGGGLQRAHRPHRRRRAARPPAPSSRPPTPPAAKGVKRIGPFAVPKAMCSGPSATLATWFKIRGINFSISSACATSTHCIGAGCRADPARQAGYRLRRRLRGARLDPLGRCSTPWAPCPAASTTARPRASRAYDATATASSSPAGRACGAGGAGPGQGARRQDLRRDRRLRRQFRRPRHGRALRRGRRALHAPGHGGAPATADRLSQSARHRHADRRLTRRWRRCARCSATPRP